jgi:hypothetical protein
MNALALYVKTVPQRVPELASITRQLCHRVSLNAIKLRFVPPPSATLCTQLKTAGLEASAGEEVQPAEASSPAQMKPLVQARLSVAVGNGRGLEALAGKVPRTG